MVTHETVTVIPVHRTPEIDEFRANLPAVMTEQEIVDAVRNNDFSLVCGGTGCGKSTQVPQFLYESGFTEGKFKGNLIGVTQPRRVAAVAVSERVGAELNDPELVGYQVRYDKKISRSGRMAIKFMTDGILLREIQENIRLPQYSVVIIDEAHERSINCDMLLGLLSGSIRARRAMGDPLRVVVMSATLKMTDFTSNAVLFPSGKSGSGIVHIDSKMFPVTVHYERRTEEEYLEVIKSKIRTIHTTLPPGTILVFVTGKKEVREVCDSFSGRVRKIIREEDNLDDFENDDENNESDNDHTAVYVGSDDMQPTTSKKQKTTEGEDFSLGVDGVVEELTFTKSGDVETTGKVSGATGGMFSGGGIGSKLRIYGLHAQMPSEKQKEVFRAIEEFPEDRVVVVSTNVAETSLTIPNVRYVIDCGRENRREFNSSGVSRFAVRFTSQASANQRAGRCGRVGPGHVYRLYSPNVFGEHMAEFPLPEVETNPLDSAILFLKSMGIADVSHLPWPTRPPALHVQAAVKRLKAIGCVGTDEKVTELGKKVSAFAVSPRLAVALTRAQETDHVFVLTAAAVATIATDLGDCGEGTGREIFLREFDDDVHAAIVWLAAWFGDIDRDDFCAGRGIAVKAMAEVAALFLQLTKGVCGVDLLKEAVRSKKFAALRTIVLQNILLGFVDQVAVREQAGGRVYRAAGNAVPVEIHRSSALFRRRPQWVGFVEMVQASGEFSDKRTMRTCFEIDPEFLAGIQSPLIDRSKTHPLMRPTKVGTRVFKYVVPKYTPLSMVIVDCLPVEDK